MIVDGGDIYGDGVNIAARLEGLAAPGGICVSGTVRDHVGDRLPYSFEDMGEQSVKNIARPVRVYALRPEITAGVPAASATPTTAAPRLSIVVLPFTNLSDDREQQYFADGITEDLTTDLSRIAGVLVISRNTAFTYRNKAIDTKQIGRELGVRYVLEGSVRRSANHIRINAQLIDAEKDTQLWAERFNGNRSDLFALQDEITRRIAVALNLELWSAEAARPSQHPDAVDYIFRAGAILMRGSPSRERYAEAIALFEHALALDPRSIDAQSGLATDLASRVIDNMTDTAEADLVRAEGLAGQALAAAPNSSLAHFAKGQLLRAQLRYEDAIPEYEAALSYNPNWVHALHALALHRVDRGSDPTGGASHQAQPTRSCHWRLVSPDRARSFGAITNERGGHVARKGAQRRSCTSGHPRLPRFRLRPCRRNRTRRGRTRRGTPVERRRPVFEPRPPAGRRRSRGSGAGDPCLV